MNSSSLNRLNRSPFTGKAELAANLNNLGECLDALGRRQEALAATEEAVIIERELAAGVSDAFRPDLAMSLNRLGNVLDALNRDRRGCDDLS